jgi:hypothetical protein
VFTFITLKNFHPARPSDKPKSHTRPAFRFVKQSLHDWKGKKLFSIQWVIGYS